MMSSSAASDSLHNRALALRAWKSGLRPDMRQLLQVRDFSFEFPFAERGVCVLRLGDTQAIARIACELVDPMPYSPKNGFVEFSVRRVAPGGRSEMGDATRLLEAMLRTSRALDTESLCVLIGKKVWSVRVDVTVLNDEGNVIDAAMWAATAALQHFRRPELTIRNDEVIVHPPNERAPVPLSLHHIPVSITSALIPNDKPLQQQPFVVDPTTCEMAAAAGCITVAVNLEGQICSVHKSNGDAVTYSTIKAAIAAASGLVPQVAAAMKQAIAADETKRKKNMLSQFQWAKTRQGVGVPPAPAVASGDASPQTESSSADPENKRRRMES